MFFKVAGGVVVGGVTVAGAAAGYVSKKMADNGGVYIVNTSKSSGDVFNFNFKGRFFNVPKADPDYQLKSACYEKSSSQKEYNEHYNNAKMGK